jgi:hypothetical protein
MRHGLFHLSAVAASLAVLALMAPGSSAQAQAPNAQTQQHGAARTETHRMAAPAKRTVHGVSTRSGAENRTVTSRRTVTNRRVVTTRRFGTTYGGTTVAGGVVGGGYVSPSYSGTYYGGGYYAVGHHSCWWYHHYAPGSIPRWCGTSYGYAAPSGYSYSYGYTSGPSRFGTTTDVSRRFAYHRQTTITHRTNMTANRKANTTTAGAHGAAKVAGMAGHHPRQQVTH